MLIYILLKALTPNRSYCMCRVWSSYLNSCFTICTLHWTMGLSADEMVCVENLYSSWNYGVMCTLVLPCPSRKCTHLKFCGRWESLNFFALAPHWHLESIRAMETPGQRTELRLWDKNFSNPFKRNLLSSTFKKNCLLALLFCSELEVPKLQNLVSVGWLLKYFLVQLWHQLFTPICD